MDLNTILQKTKEKSKRISTNRKPPSIALEERPYIFEKDDNNLLNVNLDKLKTNNSQNRDKSETNRSQINDIIESNKRQDLIQNADKTESNLSHYEVKLETKLETKNHEETNIVELHKGNALTFPELVGIQRKITLFIYNECKMNGSRSTRPLTMEYILDNCGGVMSSIKKSFQRLENKGVIIRASYKLGRGGWTKYELCHHIYNEILNSEFLYSSIGMRNRNEDKLETKTETYSDASSISIYNKITTKKNDIIPEEWLKVNFEPLTNIGFSETQIKQLVGKTDPAITQESINHFSYGLEHNEKTKRYAEPLNVLMGVLRKGQGWFEQDYRSPQEIAQDRILEQKRRELERRKTMEESAYKLAMDYWQSSLPEHEILALVPKKAGDITPQAARISMYFREHVWPTVKAEYLLES